MFGLKLLLCHFFVGEIWWFAVWLVIPAVALLIAWLVAKKHEVPDNKSAWNTLGRLWAGMGWTIVGVTIATYTIVGIYVFRAQLLPPLSATEAITGLFRTIILFLFAKYYIFCSLLPALAWLLLAWFIFIAPGNRISKAKTKLDQVEK